MARGGRGNSGSAKETHTGGAIGTEEGQPSWRKMGPRELLTHILDNITVEPILLCYIIPNLLSILTTNNLNLEKACRVNLNHTAEECDQISARNITESNAHILENATATVAEMQVWQTPLQSSVPVILILFAGSWSDRRHRRKPFMLMPLFGELCTAIGLLLCSVFFLQWPLEVAGVIEAIFPALSGGMTVMFMAVYAFLGESTSVETRTFRIGMVGTVVSCAFPVATAVSGILFEGVGFKGVYILVAVLYTLGLVYASCRIREPRTPVPRPEGMSFLADFCNWRHVWDTVKTCLKSRPGTKQLQIFLVMLVYIATEGSLQGESSLAFLYVTQQFHWTLVEFSAYGTYTIIVGVAGSFFVTAVLSGWLKLNDSIIGMLAMASKIIPAPLYAYAYLDWHIYALAATDILGSGAVIAMRAVATKIVPGHELGKLLALLGVVEAIIPVIFKPVYNKMYAKTSARLPGSFFFISCAISVVGFFAYLAIYLLQRRQVDEEPADSASEKDEGVTNIAFQGDQLPANNYPMKNIETDDTYF